jgi:hypothetical protein
MAKSIGFITSVSCEVPPPMSRYEKSYQGERRTAALRLQLTPAERAELDAAAADQGARVSTVAREMMFRRSAARPSGITPAVIDRTRKDLDASQRANNSVGVLLNQLARHANTTGELGPVRLEELDEAIAETKRATELYIAALLHVLSL